MLAHLATAFKHVNTALLPLLLPACRFLTALLMTLAPASVDSGEEGLVENVMVFSLVLGLTLGAFAGWLWLL